MDRKYIYVRIGLYTQLFGPFIGLLYEDYGGMAVLSIAGFFFALGGFIRHIVTNYYNNDK